MALGWHEGVVADWDATNLPSEFVIIVIWSFSCDCSRSNQR